MRLRRLAALSVLALSACGSPTGPSPHGLAVEPAASVIGPAPDGSALVPFTVTNDGHETRWLSRCGERLMTAVDRRVAGRWEQFSGDACLGVYASPPLELRPGEAVESVRGFTGDPGEYRLRVGVVGSPRTGTDWTAASPAFRVGSGS